MPKSKNRVKKNGKRKISKKRIVRQQNKGWDGKGGYTKTDGEGNTLCFNKRHKLMKTLYKEPLQEGEILSLDTVWKIGSTVAGKTVQEIIDWHPPYLEYWITQGVELTEEATNYLKSKIVSNGD